MTGATQTLKAQALNSHNLANAGTVGFKAELAAQAAVAVEGPQLATRVNTRLDGLGFDDRPGAIQHTGNPLDVALAEGRWLAVQAADGVEGYTRAGDLRVGPDGLMRTAAGHLVMGEGGPVSVPQNTQLSIGGDGTLTVQPQGQGAEAPVVIGRLRVVSATAAQLERGDAGLMRARNGIEPEAAAGAVLTPGALEASNVNLADAMVQLIQLARSFEMQVKLMRSAEDNAQASASLMRMA